MKKFKYGCIYKTKKEMLFCYESGKHYALMCPFKVTDKSLELNIKSTLVFSNTGDGNTQVDSIIVPLPDKEERLKTLEQCLDEAIKNNKLVNMSIIDRGIGKTSLLVKEAVKIFESEKSCSVIVEPLKATAELVIKNNLIDKMEKHIKIVSIEEALSKSFVKEHCNEQVFLDEGVLDRCIIKQLKAKYSKLTGYNRM